MQFFTYDKINDYNKLTGTDPKKAYFPLNAGRRVGKPATQFTAVGNFEDQRPAEQIEIGAWIGSRINDGTVDIDTDHAAWFDANVSQGSYTDDAAAATGSVAVGQIYYNTTNSAYQTRMS